MVIDCQKFILDRVKSFEGLTKSVLEGRWSACFDPVCVFGDSAKVFS